MKPLKPDLPIEEFLSNKDFLNAILLQLSKDLGRGGEFIEAKLDRDTEFDYTRFIGYVAAVLEEIDKSNQLDNVLYLIDLPEKVKGEPRRWGTYEELAGLVLDREFQKVWFRRWYKENS